MNNGSGCLITFILLVVFFTIFFLVALALLQMNICAGWKGDFYGVISKDKNYIRQCINEKLLR